MAQALTAKGDSDGAARAYAKAAEEVLSDAESYDMRGFMYFVSGQEELALADYEASLALDPNNADTLAWRGICRMRLKRYDAAIADFTRLIGMRPLEARGYWRRGEALVLTGKHAEALRDLDRAIALGDDERGSAHLARGMAQQALGDLDAALSSYDTAIERDSSNVSARLRRFQIYSEQEDWERCQIDADALLASAPDSPSMLLAHARLCVRNERRKDAMAAYDRLIALDPKSADAYNERADLYSIKGDTGAARADRAKAYELAPDNADIRAAHGRDLAQSAMTDEERAAGLALIVQLRGARPEEPRGVGERRLSPPRGRGGPKGHPLPHARHRARAEERRVPVGAGDVHRARGARGGERRGRVQGEPRGGAGGHGARPRALRRRGHRVRALPQAREPARAARRPPGGPRRPDAHD